MQYIFRISGDTVIIFSLLIIKSYLILRNSCISGTVLTCLALLISSEGYCIFFANTLLVDFYSDRCSQLTCNFIFVGFLKQYSCVLNSLETLDFFNIWIKTFYMALSNQFLNGLVEFACETHRPWCFLFRCNLMTTF